MPVPKKTGIPIPRVADRNVQQSLELIINRLSSLEGEFTGTVRRLAQSGLLGGPSVSDETGFFNIPVLAIPPTPKGLDALGGIGIVILSWENPFRVYRNHAHTEVWRNTVQQLSGAVKLGNAPYMVYVDDDPEDSTTYYYWIRYVSNTDVKGPYSDPVNATTAIDPAEVYAEIESWLNDSPLLEALQSPIDRINQLQRNQTLSLLTEARTIAAAMSVLATGAATAVEVSSGMTPDLTAFTVALTVLQTEVNANEAGIIARSAEITNLETRVTANETGDEAQALALTVLQTEVNANEAGIAQADTALGEIE